MSTRDPVHRRPPDEPPLPVDERLVMPETRYEVIDGKVEYVAPSDEPHGTLHSRIAALLEAHAARGYRCAVDMLTRTSKKGDMAPDASVFPEERDPETGGRKLEELAFEVVSTERLGHAAKKARALSARGVRRVFAVDVERRRALSWSRDTDTWEILAKDAVIADPVLITPLPVAALVDAAKADDAVAAALLAKKNPVLEDALRDREAAGKEAGKKLGKKLGEKSGERQGLREALLAVLEGRGLAVSKEAEARIRGEKDAARLRGWVRRAGVVPRVEELFDE